MGKPGLLHLVAVDGGHTQRWVSGVMQRLDASDWHRFDCHGRQRSWLLRVCSGRRALDPARYPTFLGKLEMWDNRCAGSLPTTSARQPLS